MNKAGVTLLGILLLLVCVRVYSLLNIVKDVKKFIVYGTSWCGYTTKQRKHLDSKYGKNSHTYVDCETGKCPKDITSFPVTISASGNKVVGFNTEM